MSYVLFLNFILHSCFDRKSVTCFLEQRTVVALDLSNYHEGNERENSELLFAHDNTWLKVDGMTAASLFPVASI